MLPPVLCYTALPARGAWSHSVARSIFARQMTGLARARWRALTLAEFSHRVAQPASPTPHPELLLSFDDGYASLAEHVYPVLGRVGLPPPRSSSRTTSGD